MTRADAAEIARRLNLELDRLQADDRTPVMFTVGAIAGVKRAIRIIDDYVKEKPC